MRVSEYYNMNIYSDRARYVGSVHDVVLDDEKGRVLGLAFGRRADKVTTVPYSSVMAIGDIVLVRSKRPASVPVEEKEKETES